MRGATDRLEFVPPPQPGLVRSFGLALLAHACLLAALTWGVRWKTETITTVTAEAELWSALPQQAAPKLVEVPPNPPNPPAPIVPVLPKPVVLPKPIPIPTPVPPKPIKAPVAAPVVPVQPKVDIALEQEKQRLKKEKEKAKEKEREKEREKEKARVKEKEAQKEREQDKAREKAKEQEKQRLDKLKQEKIKQDKLQLEKDRLKETQQQEQREQARQAAAEEKKKLAQEAKRKEALQAQQDAQRIEAQRQANLKRMAGLANASGGPTATGTALQTSGPSSSYAGRIRARIKPNIVFSDDIAGNPVAEVEVRTSPDGTIVSRKLTKSSGVKSWDEAVLRAIDKTEVLPRDVDGRVISPLTISFKPKD